MAIVNKILNIAEFILKLIGLFMMYEKLNEAKWKALVPVYDEYTLYKKVYTKSSFWTYFVCDLAFDLLSLIENPSTILYFVMFALGIIVIVVQYKFAKAFAEAFGGKKLFAILTFLMPSFMYIYVGYNKEISYQGNKYE